jgi:hypothetical protein
MKKLLLILLTGTGLSFTANTATAQDADAVVDPALGGVTGSAEMNRDAITTREQTGGNPQVNQTVRTDDYSLNDFEEDPFYGYEYEYGEMNDPAGDNDIIVTEEPDMDAITDDSGVVTTNGPSPSETDDLEDRVRLSTDSMDSGMIR